MLGAVHHQRELRRVILQATYAAMLQDPDGFMETDSLTFPGPPAGQSSRVEPPEPAAEPPASDDPQAEPNLSPLQPGAEPGTTLDHAEPTPIEVRAAVYYLIERGLVFPMPLDAMRRESIPPTELHVHITADGIDAIERLMLDGSRPPTRPIGFRVAVSSVHDARPTKAAPGQGTPSLQAQPGEATAPGAEVRSVQ